MLTYNRESLVSNAINSVLKQTFKDFELLIIDNGSLDNSGKIADDFALKDKRIKVIHKEKGNIGSGRNAGLDVALGDYIAFVDDDDTCEPDFLEFLYSLAQENSADVSICGATDKALDEKIVMSPQQAIIELMWRKKYNMAFPTKMFSKEIANKIRFPEDGEYDDIALMYKMLAFANKVAYHGLPKYTFNRHEGNNSAWTTNHSLLTISTLQEYLDAYRLRTQWLSDKFPENVEDFKYFEWSFMISMVEKISRLKLKDCYEKRDELIIALKQNKIDFLNSKHILNFEKEWMSGYIDEKYN